MRCFHAYIFLSLLGLLPVFSLGQDTYLSAKHPASDLSAWTDLKYHEANSAKDESYLSEVEKEVYYYLNLVRMNPKLFADTYLKEMKNSANSYESSLYAELQKLKPLPVLMPDRKLYESARCHAAESGKRGFVGHKRFKCDEYYLGECIYYGETDALGIVTALLVDEGVKSLGHRRIFLDNFTQLGVSIQPHKTFGENCVLDFY